MSLYNSTASKVIVKNFKEMDKTDLSKFIDLIYLKYI